MKNLLIIWLIILLSYAMDTVSIRSEENEKDRAAKVRGLIEQLDSKNDNPWRDCYHAIYELGKLGAKEALPVIIKKLKDSNEWIRGAAIYVIGQLGNKEMIPEIVLCLHDVDDEVRRNAIFALGALDAKEKLSELVKLLEDKEGFVAMEAAELLVWFEAKETIPEIIKLLKEKKAVGAIYALGEFRTKEAVPLLISLVHDKDSWIREKTVEALGKIGSREAIPELTKLLKSKEPSLLWETMRALGHIGAQEAIPQIMELLRYDKDQTWMGKVVRRISIETLGELEAKEAIPELIKLLKKEEFDIRIEALSALGKINAREAISEIEKLLDSKEYHEEAVLALIRLGKKEIVGEALRLIKASPRAGSLHSRNPEGQIFYALNRLINLELYQKINSAKINWFRVYSDSNASTIIDDLNKKYNLNIVISKEVGLAEMNDIKRFGVRKFMFNQTQLIDLLGYLFREDILLVDNKIKIVSRDEFFSFWDKWWKENQDKLMEEKK